MQSTRSPKVADHDSKSEPNLHVYLSRILHERPLSARYQAELDTKHQAFERNLTSATQSEEEVGRAEPARAVEVISKVQMILNVGHQSGGLWNRCQ